MKPAQSEPENEEAVMRASNSTEGVLKPRVWILNQKTEEVFCLHFDFKGPIFQGTVMEGMLLLDGQFHVRRVNFWCGGDHRNATSAKTFLRQQLNVWFHSPEWHTPRLTDAFRFVIDIQDDPVPRGLSTKEQLPAFSDEELTAWQDHHRLCELRIFRLYKTQYPFVYSMMPDDDHQANQLKTKLKQSTDSDNRIQLKPLLATILTAQAELVLHDAFCTAGKKIQYLRWQCGRYAPVDNSHAGVWVPIKNV